MSWLELEWVLVSCGLSCEGIVSKKTPRSNAPYLNLALCDQGKNTGSGDGSAGNLREAGLLFQNEAQS